MKTLWAMLILAAIGIMGVLAYQTGAAAAEEAEDKRRTEIVVSVNEYQWWLIRWATNEIVCVTGVDHEGQPSNLEILSACGQTLYKEWQISAPCDEAASGDVSGCPGLYIFLAGQKTVEKNVTIELPKPTIWLSLSGCSPQPPLNLCERLPSLVLTGEEPLPNETITAMHLAFSDRVFDCIGSVCEFPLEATAYDGEEVEFWAESSYGDESERFTARVRVLDAGVQPEPGAGNWFVDIISSQWRGDPNESCAAMWEAFPPVGPQPQWLSTPVDHTGLASNVPFVFLAGELIRSGIVDVSACVDHGLLANGAASPCGVEHARTLVNDWQDQFDAEIFRVAQDRLIPAQLLKNLFAQESQFWPGESDIQEFGFGRITELGVDTILLWNLDFYDQFCPLVLHEETCSKGYAFIGEENQELLRGALVVESDAACPTCITGVDLAHAQTTVDFFAETVVANCAQVAFIVSDITGEIPGAVSTYESLWQFTLASYNAGPYCLARALNVAWAQFGVLDWGTVASRLGAGCTGAITYVDRITADRLPADADFLPTLTPIATPFQTPVPGATQPAPTATPGGYPAPTATSPGYP
ncbi:MAG TPA: hypothetical protein VMN57_08190 [Anaerolineales bacterium]|nr:hypothetical protein [Anaerolineales bacterium]